MKYLKKFESTAYNIELNRFSIFLITFISINTVYELNYRESNIETSFWYSPGIPFIDRQINHRSVLPDSGPVYKIKKHVFDLNYLDKTY